MTKKPVRKDTNQLAKNVVEILTGQKPKPKKKKALRVAGKK